MKISGLDALAKTLQDAQAALENLEGELEVSFDPEDPGSIERAIRQSETLVDQRIGQSADNPIVASLAEQTKAHFRQAIIDKAAAARLEGPDGDDD